MSAKQPQPWHWITELFQTSARRADERRIGVEIERIGIWPDGSTLHYRDRTLPDGQKRIGAGELLRKLEGQPQWAVITNDKGCPLGFTTPLGKVSLEPGSQVELSTNPAIDMASLVKNVQDFDIALNSVSRPEGLAWIGLGLNPLEGVEEMDVIPSTRYGIMTDYLGKRGSLGTSMMRLTTSVQVNLDYTSEAEAIEMLRVSLAVAPVSYAIFGNSPLRHGKDSGFLSYRRMIWRDTDPDRTGLLAVAFDPSFSFCNYAKQIWHQPLMFAQDSRKAYVPGKGMSLAQLADNRIPDVAADETNQYNAIREFFTEARLKPGYIEVRSIDGLRSADRYAATAFWTGLLYSAEARRLAMELVGKISAQEREESTLDAAKNGLRSRIAGRSMKEVALALTDAAKTSLKGRGRREESYLNPIYGYLDQNTNPAETVLRLFNGDWKQRTQPLVEYCAQ